MAASQPDKLCFVTVGATASFHLLLQAVLEQAFWDALHRSGYTHLLIQYGKDGRSLYEESLGKVSNRHGIQISGFDFNHEGLDGEMALCQCNPSENRSGGMIISHAGNEKLVWPVAWNPLHLYQCRRGNGSRIVFKHNSNKGKTNASLKQDRAVSSARYASVSPWWWFPIRR